MSEEMPTTEEIREYYAKQFTIVDGKILRASAPGDPEDLAEFDRWLKQHDAEVAQATEERIIKLLLDEHKADHIPHGEACWCTYQIELIEGGK
jgi:hypothetical protein